MSKFSQMALHRLSPMAVKRNFMIGAIDSETKGLDGKALLFQMYHETWDEARLYKTPDELFEDLLSLDKKLLSKSIFYSHNGEYDWRYLYPVFEQYKDRIGLRMIERMEGKFFQIDILSKTDFDKNGNPVVITRLRDSYAIYPFSLRKFTHSMVPHLEKRDIGLSYRDFDPDNEDDLAYARNDVIALVEALKVFDDIVYNHFKVHLKGTIASTSLQAWLRQAPAGEYYDRLGRSTDDYTRKSYVGGIVKINAEDREYKQLTCYDINSSYPASMRKGVPYGKPITTYRYEPDYPGIYTVSVFVPDDFVNSIVPQRDEKTGCLSWPTGRVDTTVTSLEIEHFRAQGLRVEVKSGIYFPGGLTHPFNDFVDICEKLRAEYKGTSTEIVVKLLQNSLYGKFGTRTEGREVVVDFDGEPEGYMPVMTGELETVPNVYWRPSERDANYMLPHWASWITANARILLDTYVDVAGPENVYYRDTDSLVVNDAGGDNLKNEGTLGVAYGFLKSEKVLNDVKFHAPKCYTYTDKNGVTQAVYKGVPKSILEIPHVNDPKYAQKLASRNELIATLHRGEDVTFEYHSSHSLQTFWKTNKRSQIRKRTNTNIRNVYGHIIENGKFRPRRTGLWE